MELTLPLKVSIAPGSGWTNEEYQYNLYPTGLFEFSKNKGYHKNIRFGVPG